MNKVYETTLAVIIGFLISLVINSIISYVIEPKVTVMFGDAINISDKNYMTLDIANYKESAIDDIELAVPKNLEIESIAASSSVQISLMKDEISPYNQKVLIISNLESNRITRLYIPLNRIEDKPLFRILNRKKNDIELITVDNLENPIKKAIFDALFVSIFYAIGIGLAAWGTIVNLEKVKAETAEAREELNNIRAKLTKIETTAHKLRLLLMSRLSDYSKELSFWRDTIRKLLYDNSKEYKIKADSVIKEVTKSLKTYGTLDDSSYDFDAIVMLAKQLKEDTD